MSDCEVCGGSGTTLATPHDRDYTEVLNRFPCKACNGTGRMTSPVAPSLTPRTDAANAEIWATANGYVSGYDAMKKFARQLERELAEARADLALEREGCTIYKAKFIEAQAEVERLRKVIAGSGMVCAVVEEQKT